MEFLPAPPLASPGDKDSFDKIRAAGKVAGTLVTAAMWARKRPAILLCPFAPFLRLGLNDIKTQLGR
jgi:hypothetical protein